MEEIAFSHEPIGKPHVHNKTELNLLALTCNTDHTREKKNTKDDNPGNGRIKSKKRKSSVQLEFKQDRLNKKTIKSKERKTHKKKSNSEAQTGTEKDSHTPEISSKSKKGCKFKMLNETLLKQPGTM